MNSIQKGFFRAAGNKRGLEAHLLELDTHERKNKKPA
jgi:hypothetical protein